MEAKTKEEDGAVDGRNELETFSYLSLFLAFCRLYGLYPYPLYFLRGVTQHVFIFMEFSYLAALNLVEDSLLSFNMLVHYKSCHKAKPGSFSYLQAKKSQKWHRRIVDCTLFYFRNFPSIEQRDGQQCSILKAKNGIPFCIQMFY